jgi:hypothetical protein
MNHGFETQINLTATDDLGHIARVVRLQQCNFDAFILEISFGLGQIQWGVVCGCVPTQRLSAITSIL